MVIPFDRRFEAHEIKLDLFTEIIAEELPGIFNEALAGQKRLDDRGDFDEPAECLAAKDMFFALANPLRGFIDERIVPADGAKIPLSVFYARLRAWSAEVGLKVPFARNATKNRVEAAGLKTAKLHPGINYVLDVSFASNPET